MDQAWRIWLKTVPAAGTLVDVYLQSRGLALPPTDDIRCLPAEWHIATQMERPAMAVLMRHGSTSEAQGVQITYLRLDGRGKVPVEPVRLSYGAMTGGAVRLAEAAEGKPLIVGEGAETVLGAMQEFELPGWATLGTGNMLTLELPPWARDILIAADNDQPGEDAAQAARERWVLQGRRVRIVRPPQGMKDFADVAKARREQGGR